MKLRIVVTSFKYSTLPGTWGSDTEDLIIGKVKEMAGSSDQ